MAKDKKDKHHKKGPDLPRHGASEGADTAAGGQHDAGTNLAGGQHHAATAHGRPTQVDTSLPATRPELMDLHRAARERRNAAPLGSPAFRAAVMDLEKIEVRIAAIDRAADPPLG